MSNLNLPINFHQKLTLYQRRVDEKLKNFIQPLPSHSRQLIEAIRYTVLCGGKRIRPYLVYATGKMFGLSPGSLDVAAAAVECIHAYSLVHDDLPAMDDDNLRRGQPSCHIKFGEAIAILVGDALQTLAFSLLADQPMPNVTLENRLKIVSELAKAIGAGGMCSGQALDLAAKHCQISLASLEKIHRHKTGALIRAAVRIGALAAGERSEKTLSLLDDYADAIGLAFQIQDDILDITGETDRMGKKQGADQKRKKSTYSSLLGLEGAKIKAKKFCQDAQIALDILASQSLQDSGAYYDTRSLRALALFIIQRDH